ncbi:hypothetical protein BDV93DRAFT_434412, partial [Ceratobasidium sp. AG-I]
TLYIDEKTARALGWKPGQDLKGVQLTLHGWAPSYFAITEKDTESERLARGTVESSRDPVVQEVLDQLKDR